MSSILLKVFALFSILLLAAASPLAARQNQCNTGPIQCCNQVQSAGSPDMSKLLGLLNIVVNGADVPIGVNCSPLTVGGIGEGGKCDAQPVCCEDNAQGGLISVGCIPISIDL